MNQKAPTIDMDRVGSATAQAFKAGMQGVEPHEVAALASTLGVLCVAFLRSQCGEEFVRDYLAAAQADLDKPAQIHVRVPQIRH